MTCGKHAWYSTAISALAAARTGAGQARTPRPRGQVPRSRGAGLSGAWGPGKSVTVSQLPERILVPSFLLAFPI